MTRAGLPDRDRVVREVAGHDRAGADDDVPADRDAAEHDRAVTEPRPDADAHRARRRELPADRLVGILVAVVGVGDVHVMTGPHVVADLDRSWPTMPLPFPIRQRSPIVMTVPSRTCSGDTPADSVTYGPIMHPAPTWMDSSPNSAATGKQITLSLTEAREPPRPSMPRPDGADIDGTLPSGLHEVAEGAPHYVERAADRGV